MVEKTLNQKGTKTSKCSLGEVLVFGKAVEQKILESIRKAALSVDYGEVVVKIDKSAPRTEIVILTQEKFRVEKTLDTNYK